MNCPRCASDNDSARKFCRVCGAPLGSLCDRCGHVNTIIDEYCGNCGFGLIASVQDAGEKRNPLSLLPVDMPRQYTPNEIHELLSLREAMRQRSADGEQLNQDEIDALFA